MGLITSHHYGGNSSNLVLKNADGNIVVVFEDKSTVLGNKIEVFDGEGNMILFLDEDISQTYDAFSIIKDSTVIAAVRLEDIVVHRLVKIECKNCEYSFSLFNRVLQKDGKKIAKLIVHNKEKLFDIELFTDENIVFTLTLLYAIFELMS